MLPFIREGDLVILNRREIIRVGDLVAYQGTKSIFLHRVIEIESQILTKGDNEFIFDKPIDSVSILGVAKFIVRNKKCIDLNCVNQIPFVKISKFQNTFYRYTKFLFRLSIFSKYISCIFFNLFKMHASKYRNQWV